MAPGFASAGFAAEFPPQKLPQEFAYLANGIWQRAAPWHSSAWNVVYWATVVATLAVSFLHSQRRDDVVTGKGNSRLFRFPGAVRSDPAIEAWMRAHSGELGAIAQTWFDVMRACGSDVRELLHDGHPTACVSDAAFGYVNAFTAHVNVGFFRGAEISDPRGLLQGTGKLMRHVKLAPDRDADVPALTKLIEAAYADMKERLRAE